ncbi:hypothetical protein Btru_017790 [Bulinus truncatus]|nr:hypothetical protein Btru_017790 [Bulinus truncatus]
MTAVNDCSCPDGQWGVHCNKTCSNGCKDKLCDKTNGHCSIGCPASFQLQIVSTVGCNDFQWSENCEYNCSYFCLNKTCDKVNGFCLEGLIAGFEPPRCTIECAKDYFGPNCSLTCPSFCPDSEYYQLSGHCKNSSTADQALTTKEVKHSHTDFGVGFGAGIATATCVFGISLVILYIWHKRQIRSINKQYQQSQPYSQLEIPQAERHVYDQALNAVTEKDQHSSM